MAPNLTNSAIALILFINLTFITERVLAGEECRDPIAQWQSRAVLKKRIEEQGWVVQRIRIDDGCYEVRALDEEGRRIKAIYTPASLTLQKIEVKNHHRKSRQHRDPQH